VITPPAAVMASADPAGQDPELIVVCSVSPLLTTPEETTRLVMETSS